jgi:hypothetical protein
VVKFSRRQSVAEIIHASRGKERAKTPPATASSLEDMMLAAENLSANGFKRHSAEQTRDNGNRRFDISSKSKTFDMSDLTTLHAVIEAEEEARSPLSALLYESKSSYRHTRPVNWAAAASL